MRRVIATSGALMLAVSAVSAITSTEIKSGFSAMLASGKKVRMAWCQGGTQASPAGTAIYGVDSDDGVVRKIYPASGSVNGTWTCVTADGSRVIFNDANAGSIKVVNWDGTGTPKTVSGECNDYWRNPADNTDWAVVYGGGSNVYRINIDATGSKVNLWTTSPSVENVSLSPDGTHMAGFFEGSSAWVAGVAVVPNGAVTLEANGGGCVANIAPDGTYRFMRQVSAHKEVRICSGASNCVNVNVTDSILAWAQRTGNIATTCVGYDAQFQGTRWTNDPDYLAFSMDNVKANPFFYRFSDKKWLRLQDGLNCTWTGYADAVIFTATDVVRHPSSIRAHSALRGRDGECYGTDGRRLSAASGAERGIVVSRAASPGRGVVVVGRP